LNLLFTITAYPPSVGGAQAHFHELARRLVQRHRLQVVAHWAETRTDWLLGTTLRSPTPPRVAGATERDYTLGGVPVQLLSFTRRERLDALPYVLGYYLSKGLAISHISDLLLRQLEQYAHGVELIHNGRVGREGLSFASLKLARRLRVPFVLTPFHHPRWAGWNYKHYQWLYRAADGVIALTESERQALIRLGVAPARVFVTGMGPILAEFPDGALFRQEYCVAGPMVLFLGQKYRYKGCAALLEAAPLVWARHPEAQFVFIGPRTRHSRMLFKRHNDRRIVELDVVDLETKTNALAACDLLCLPSTQESFGGVFTEAWMLNKPVIGGCAPAIREVIDEGVDGYVVDQEAGAIAERITYLLDHPSMGQEMGAQGRAKVAAHFAWERLAETTESAYRVILG
jgi:glycosyltransferase involved in cell wall biosynthesis